jgi:hypothetical protein
MLLASALWEAALRPAARRLERRRVALRAAAVVPGTTVCEEVPLDGDRRGPVRRAHAPVARVALRAMDASGRTLGYVVPFRGDGFQHEIQGLLAVTPQLDRILSLTIDESRDSARGDLFENAGPFLSQFSSRVSSGPVLLVPRGIPGIHAISGASISSQLLVRLVNESRERLRAALDAGRQPTGGPR